MPELHDLLRQATDRIESPRLERVALQTARRRRARLPVEASVVFAQQMMRATGPG